ncbi:hypothetical protein GSI_01416 [Ganoderma sinense ZZ0214-1]|uniref:Uncharacterized protein n=1 Tax=Ganoderma sinense ZZ0214-1 TaxID=1077348 RepID=A0A2G8SVG1_9APHY|nr:hypothetical protein GSI_01416 [Ganoderma sinense ZZ0214-1]
MLQLSHLTGSLPRATRAGPIWTRSRSLGCRRWIFTRSAKMNGETHRSLGILMSARAAAESPLELLDSVRKSDLRRMFRCVSVMPEWYRSVRARVRCPSSVAPVAGRGRRNANRVVGCASVWARAARA